MAQKTMKLAPQTCIISMVTSHIPSTLAALMPSLCIVSVSETDRLCIFVCLFVYFLFVYLFVILYNICRMYISLHLVGCWSLCGSANSVELLRVKCLFSYFLSFSSDDSGKWGHGGLFTAISQRSLQPETRYELAARMKGETLGCDSGQCINVRLMWIC